MIKHDGGHFYLVVDSQGNHRYFSRRESVKTPGTFPERTSQLPHLTEVKTPEFAGHTYSVELVHTGKNKNSKDDHSAASGILNSLAPKAIATQAETGPIRAVLLDVINPSINTFRSKIAHMKGFEAAVNRPDVLFTPTYHYGIPGVVHVLNTTKEQGREGVIVTELDEPESTNTRVKIKHYKTFNLRIAGITQAEDIKGNKKDMVGSFVLNDASGKFVGNVGTGLNRETAIDAWTNPRNYIGEIAQVKCMDVTKAGILRQPVWNGLADGSIDHVK